MQVVKTDNGYVSGTVIGEPCKETYIFRGIPYAAPPVGDLRWRPPQPAKAWTGIRECTHFSNICPQKAGGTAEGGQMSEDCLYLNVITPAQKPNARLPVMVWLHGGAYIMGSGNSPLFNGYRLPQNGVVLVTVTHRIGVFGMAAHAELSRESARGVSGNYIFLDLIAALQWVKNNIAGFGGDPDNVTIFGESGGGAKVCVMMTTPLSKGLFHRAICESGTALGQHRGKPMREMEASGEILFEKMGAKTLEQARKVSWQDVLTANTAMEIPAVPPHRLLPEQPWDAALDGWFLPQSPVEAFPAGNINAVPLITMACLGEITGPSLLVTPQIITHYQTMLEALAKKGINGYACIFDWIPEHWRREGGVAAHSTELTYLFGDWDNRSGWWHSIAHFMLTSGAKTRDIVLNEKDRSVSESMMKIWAQFAKTGRPSVKGLVDWPAWDKSAEKYLNISQPVEIRSGFGKLALTKIAAGKE